MESMDRASMLAVFAKLDEVMERRQRVCVIGGAAVIGYGNPLRQTQDIDVWRAASAIDEGDFARASRKAGIGYDPTGEDPEGVYVQIVDPGIVQLPGYRDGRWATGAESRTIWSGRNLVVEAPPPDVVIASKLVRAADRDIDDAVWLVEAKAVDLADVRKATRLLPDRHAGEAAGENLALLEVVLQAPGKARGIDAGRPRDMAHDSAQDPGRGGRG